MGALSVEAQDEGIRHLFPAFQQTCALDFVGAWRGPLRPLARTYEISIVYFPRLRFGGAIIANPWIIVEVLDPLIGLDPRGTGRSRHTSTRIPGGRTAGRSASTTRRPMGA